MVIKGYSEGIHGDFFEYSINLLCVIDTKGMFLELNPEWKKTFGYEIDEMEGKSFIDFVHPDDIEKTTKVVQEIVNNGDVKDFTNRYRHKDSTYRWLEWRVFSKDDKIYASARDITERKLNEEYLNMFKISIDSTIDDVYWINAEGGFDYFNNGACKMLGYTPEELGRLKLTDIDPTIKIEDHISTWKRLYENKKNEDHVMESTHKKKDGTLLPIEINGSFIWMGTKGFLLTYVKDITERKQSEEALLKNQKLLVESQRITKMGSWEMELTDFKLYWNKAAYQLYGYEYKEIEPTLETFFQLVHPDDLDLVKKHLDTTLQTKLFKDFECRIIRPDGKTRSILVAGEVSLDRHNNPYRMFGIVQDITERKEATIALRRSEEKLRSIFRVAPVGIGIIADRVHIDANPYICRITGFSKEEIIGKSTRILYPSEEEYLRVGRIIYKQIYTKGIEEMEAIWRRKNGKLINIYLAGTSIDITTQKKIEKELIEAKERAEESEYFLRESQRTANIGSLKLDLVTGKWISTETLDSILGIDRSYDKRFSNFVKIVHPDYQEKFNKYLNNIISKDQAFNYEYPIVRYNDGEKRWIHGVGKIYYDKDGNPGEMLGTVQDVTEPRLLEEETKKLNVELEIRVAERTAQLKQANQDLESFAYSVSHDLRAPLPHIDGFMRLMKNAIEPMNAKVQNYFDKITSSSKRMSAMIDELLQFSRLGRTDLKTKSVSLSTLVHNIVEQLKP